MTPVPNYKHFSKAENICSGQSPWTIFVSEDCTISEVKLLKGLGVAICSHGDIQAWDTT